MDTYLLCSLYSSSNDRTVSFLMLETGIVSLLLFFEETFSNRTELFSFAILNFVC